MDILHNRARRQRLRRPRCACIRGFVNQPDIIGMPTGVSGIGTRKPKAIVPVGGIRRNGIPSGPRIGSFENPSARCRRIARVSRGEIQRSTKVRSPHRNLRPVHPAIRCFQEFPRHPRHKAGCIRSEKHSGIRPGIRISDIRSHLEPGIAPVRGLHHDIVANRIPNRSRWKMHPIQITAIRNRMLKLPSRRLRQQHRTNTNL